MAEGDYRFVRVELMSDLQLHTHVCRPACKPDVAVHAIPYWM